MPQYVAKSTSVHKRVLVQFEKYAEGVG